MESKKEAKKISLTSTKQEMLQAYNAILKELEARAKRTPPRKAGRGKEKS